jgi:cytochrome P450
MLTGVQKQRKDLMPAFAFRHVKNLYPVFWTKSVELVDAVTSESRTSSVDISAWASRAALDIIGVAGSEYCPSPVSIAATTSPLRPLTSVTCPIQFNSDL